MARSILTIKMLILHGHMHGYMGTQMTRITLHGMHMYITYDHLGTFFSDYNPVEGVSSIKNKSGITTRDFEVLVILTQHKFNEIPNVITSGGQNIFFIIENHNPTTGFVVLMDTWQSCCVWPGIRQHRLNLHQNNPGWKNQRRPPVVLMYVLR